MKRRVAMGLVIVLLAVASVGGASGASGAVDALGLAMAGIAGKLGLTVVESQGSMAEGGVWLMLEEPAGDGTGPARGYMIGAMPWFDAAWGYGDKQAYADEGLMSVLEENGWDASYTVQLAVEMPELGIRYNQALFESEWSGIARSFAVGEYALVAYAYTYPGEPDEVSYAVLDEIMGEMVGLDWPEVTSLQDLVAAVQGYPQEVGIGTRAQVEGWGRLIASLLSRGSAGAKSGDVAYETTVLQVSGDAPAGLPEAVEALEGYAQAMSAVGTRGWRDAAALVSVVAGNATGDAYDCLVDLYVACLANDVCIPGEKEAESRTEADRLRRLYIGILGSLSQELQERVLITICREHWNIGGWRAAEEVAPLVGAYVRTGATASVPDILWSHMLDSGAGAAALAVVLSEVEAEGYPVQAALARVDDVLEDDGVAVYGTLADEVAAFDAYQAQFPGGLRLLGGQRYSVRLGLTYDALYRLLDGRGKVYAHLMEYAGPQVEAGGPEVYVRWTEHALKTALGDLQLPTADAEPDRYVLVSDTGNMYRLKGQSEIEEADAARQMKEIATALNGVAAVTDNPLEASFALRYRATYPSAGRYSGPGISAEVFGLEVRLEAVDLATGEVIAGVTCRKTPGTTISVTGGGRVYMTIEDFSQRGEVAVLREAVRAWIEGRGE